MSILFLGPPGSGKGTQAKLLAAQHGFTHLSTGDMLREEIKNETALGKKAKESMDRGELVSDALIIELMESRIKGHDKVLLDGFPRTIAQAEALAVNPHICPKQVIYFEINKKALVHRLLGRRVCTDCGESYHVELMPPKKVEICDKCGERLIQRSDDEIAVVSKRLEVYDKQTAPLLEYYGKNGQLTRIKADRPVEEVSEELVSVLSSIPEGTATGHTPGPWGKGKTIIMAPHPWAKGSTLIAAVFGEGDPKYPDGEVDANADLICAAPDLLAACKILLDYVLEEAGPTCRGVEEATRAIDKAEGR